MDFTGLSEFALCSLKVRFVEPVGGRGVSPLSKLFEIRSFLARFCTAKDRGGAPGDASDAYAAPD